MPKPRRPHSADRLNQPFSAEGLRRAVRHGSRRTLMAQAASHVVSLLLLASLYHLVTPADFGLIGMALPIIMFLRIFTSLGMNIATVQSRELSTDLISQLFWIHLGLGVATAVATVLIAPAAAWFYREPAAAVVTAALSATSVASALGLQHIALLERNLRLGSAAVCRLAGQAAGGVLAIALALAGWGVWALVWQQYLELLVLAAVAWNLEPWRPIRPRAKEPLNKALHLGGYFTGSQIVFNLLANIDKILVGFLLGREALGFYSQAFNVMMKPVVVLTTPLNSVILPALSRAAHDPPTYGQIVLAFQRLLAVASFPAGVGLMLVGRETMLVLGGHTWDDAGPLLMVLAASVLVQGFINMAGAVFLSAGQWRAMLASSVAMLVLLVPGLVVGYAAGQHLGAALPGSDWGYDHPAADTSWFAGTLGIAWGYSLTTCAMFVPYMLLCLKVAGVSSRDWARQLVRPALASIGMGAVVWGTRALLVPQSWLPPWGVLATQIAVGVAAYVLLARSEIRWCLERLRRF